jgi:hypothetical protein
MRDRASSIESSLCGKGVGRRPSVAIDFAIKDGLQNGFLFKRYMNDMPRLALEIRSNEFAAGARI